MIANVTTKKNPEKSKAISHTPVALHALVHHLCLNFTVYVIQLLLSISRS